MSFVVRSFIYIKSSICLTSHPPRRHSRTSFIRIIRGEKKTNPGKKDYIIRYIILFIGVKGSRMCGLFLWTFLESHFYIYIYSMRCSPPALSSTFLIYTLVVCPKTFPIHHKTHVSLCSEKCMLMLMGTTQRSRTYPFNLRERISQHPMSSSLCIW